MEILINDFSYGLFLWQAFMLVVLIVGLYFMVKLYRKVMRYLDSATNAAEQTSKKT